MAVPVTKLVLGAFGIPSWVKRRSYEDKWCEWWYHLKERWWFYIGSIITIALSLTIQAQFAIECLWCSNEQGVGHFGQNLGKKGLTDVIQILTRSGRDMGLWYRMQKKPYQYLLLFEHNAWAWQTDRQRPRNGNISTNRWNHFSAMLPNKCFMWFMSLVIKSLRPLDIWVDSHMIRWY